MFMVIMKNQHDDFIFSWSYGTNLDEERNLKGHSDYFFLVSLNKTCCWTIGGQYFSLVKFG